MLISQKLLRFSLLILLTDIITICINAKSLPYKGNTNEKRFLKTNIQIAETNLRTSIPHEPELYTLPKPIKYIHPTPRPSISTVRYMNDIEYDLRLRQLMEELVLKSRYDNNQQTVQTSLPPNRKINQPIISSDKLAQMSAVHTNPIFNANKIQQDLISSVKDSHLNFILLEYMTNSKQNISHFIADIKTNATANFNSTDASDSQRIRQQLAFLQKNAEKFKKFQQVQERTKNKTQWENVLREMDQIADIDFIKNTQNYTQNIDNIPNKKFSNTGNHLMNETSNKNEQVIVTSSFDNSDKNENKHKLHDPESLNIDKKNKDISDQQSNYKNRTTVQKSSTDFENKNYSDSTKYNKNFTFPQNTTNPETNKSSHVRANINVAIEQGKMDENVQKYVLVNKNANIIHDFDKSIALKLNNTKDPLHKDDITITNNRNTTTSFNDIESSTELSVVNINLNNIPTITIDNYQKETRSVNNQHQKAEKEIDGPNIEKGTPSNTITLNQNNMNDSRPVITLPTLKSPEVQHEKNSSDVRMKVFATGDLMFDANQYPKLQRLAEESEKQIVSLPAGSTTEFSVPFVESSKDFYRALQESKTQDTSAQIVIQSATNVVSTEEQQLAQSKFINELSFQTTVQPIYKELPLINLEDSNQIDSSTDLPIPRNTDVPPTTGIFDTIELTTSHTFNLPTMVAASSSNGQTESVSEYLSLTQSNSYQTPSIIRENGPNKTSISGSHSVNSNNQPSTVKEYILKPEERFDNLTKLLKIIGNSLQDSAYANKEHKHKQINRTNVNVQHKEHKKQQLLVKVTSTVNCHTETMQLSTPSSTQFPYSSEAAAQRNEKIAIDKTTENHKQSKEKWPTLKNNQLNIDTLTKANNDDKMKKNVHVNVNANIEAAADVDVNDSDCDDDDDEDDNVANNKGTTTATSSDDMDIRLDKKVDVDIENENVNDNNNPNERVNIEPASAATATGQKYWTNNEFNVSPIEGGISEMSTFDNKLLDISKHSSNGMTNTRKTIPSTSTYDKHVIVNKNSKKVFANNGNKDENTINYYNSSHRIEQNQRDVYEDIDNDENNNNDDDYNVNDDKMNVEIKEISTISDAILNSQPFPDITPYHSNPNDDDKHILSSGQMKQEITATNWWHSVPYAEIRKFLNSILESVTSSTDFSINRSVDTMFKTMTATSKTIVKPIKERKSKEQWPSLIFNYIWSLLL